MPTQGDIHAMARSYFLDKIAEAAYVKVSFQRQPSDLSPSDCFLQRLQVLEAIILLHDVVRPVTVASHGTINACLVQEPTLQHFRVPSWRYKPFWFFFGNAIFFCLCKWLWALTDYI